MLLPLVLLVFGTSHALPEKCLRVSPMKNFDVVRYLGTWYEYSRSESALEGGTKCNYETYKLLPNGSLDVFNEGINELTGEVQPVPSIMTMKHDGSGESYAYFSDIDAWVVCYFLDTDYKNWAAAYCCAANNDALYWIVTRARQPLRRHVACAKAAFRKAKVDVSKLSLIDQKTCEDTDCDSCANRRNSYSWR